MVNICFRQVAVALFPPWSPPPNSQMLPLTLRPQAVQTRLCHSVVECARLLARLQRCGACNGIVTPQPIKKPFLRTLIGEFCMASESFESSFACHLTAISQRTNSCTFGIYNLTTRIGKAISKETLAMFFGSDTILMWLAWRQEAVSY